MITFLSMRIADKLSILIDAGIVEDQKALSSKITNVIINYTTLFILIITGLLFHNLPETMIGFVSFCLFRLLNGGFHLKKAEHCIIFSSCLLVLIPLAAPYIGNHEYIYFSISVIFILIFAPTKRTFKTNVTQRKFLSIVICIMVILLNNPAIDAALFFSSMTLIPIRKKR